MSTPPTAIRGYIDDQLTYSGVLADLTELVPECLWPRSNMTYRQMRHHHQLAAVEKAYTLPIRRASWGLSPAGCNPKVVARNADDMGLPVIGQDQPGAARVRGVSWAEHLRLALLDIAYGHSGFEMLVEIRGGQARLIELSERLPSTISEIHTDPVGRLAGVTQLMYDGKASPQIPANRLVWYAREREGAAWWGRSIFRPAYPAWLLAREMLRVTAVGHRRFSVGVPTGEWDPGIVPTPEQQVALQKAMSATRVSDEGGLAMPPGAHMKLVGLTGTVPDTLAFIRYLDQAMSREALAGFLDLGTTETGSRALAGEFIDLFLLALQAEADAIADVASRQISARLVEWNEGDDEPVPAVQAGDVGAKHEVTAESLKILLDSGALSADPALEAYVRQRFHLPERDDTVLPAPSVRGDTVTAANRKARPRRPAPSPAQLELPITAAAGDPTPDYTQIQQDWETARDGTLKDWPGTAAPLVTALVTSATSAVASGALAELGALTVDAAVLAGLAAVIGGAMATLADTAAGQARAEAATLGITSDAAADQGRLDALAAAFAGQISAGYAQAAGRKALASAGAADLADLLRDYLDDMSAAATGLVADSLGMAFTAAQNSGRAAVFADLPGVEWVAAEHNDRQACAPCRSQDGTVYETWADAEVAYPVMGFNGCSGGGRCRGQLRIQLA
jgi:hypothetical protein